MKKSKMAVTVLRKMYIDDLDARDEFYREARRVDCEVKKQDGILYTVTEWRPELNDFGP